MEFGLQIHLSLGRSAAAHGQLVAHIFNAGTHALTHAPRECAVALVVPEHALARLEGDIPVDEDDEDDDDDGGGGGW